MGETENHTVPVATNDSWRSWLMTGARRNAVDPRRMRGAHRGLKKILLEGMATGDQNPPTWTDFSGAMVRHAVDEAMRTLPKEDDQVVKLAYFGTYSNREIASVVGLTEGTVQRRLRRALEAISDHIQHGKALGRRALYGLGIWLSGRWIGDAFQHALPVGAVAAATVIILVQPASNPTGVREGVDSAVPSTTNTVVPPVPSPTVPEVVPSPGALTAPAMPVDTPSVQLPSVQVPSLKLPDPSPLPPLPTD
jgi:RNA polymerase sigma factor (sigma-70 family)